MGKVTIVKGDLFDTDAPLLAHSVNLRGKFASGVAGQVRRLFPEAYEQYMARTRGDRGWHLGDVQFVSIYDHPTLRLVANMATQDAYGYDGALYADYDAIAACFETVLRFAEAEGMAVALPAVGCGLGGGDWKIVEGLLRDAAAPRDVSVRVYLGPQARGV